MDGFGTASELRVADRTYRMVLFTPLLRHGFEIHCLAYSPWILM